MLNGEYMPFFFVPIMNNVQQDWWMSTIPNSGGTIDANTPIAGLPSNLDTIAEQVTALQTALSQAAGAMQRNVYDADNNSRVDTVDYVDGGFLP